MYSSLKCSSAVSFSAVYQCQILSISQNLSTDMHGRLYIPRKLYVSTSEILKRAKLKCPFIRIERLFTHLSLQFIAYFFLIKPRISGNYREQFFIQHSTFADKRLLSLYGRTSVLRNYLFNFSPTSVGVFKRISVRRLTT